MIEDASALTPKKAYIVGIGASAGGLEAIESFFKRMPSDTGLSFVVVQHLSPDYKSLMAELLSKHTAMPVNRIEEGMKVEPNNIYLIPPRKNLTLFHDHLLLNNQDHSKELNLPIDIFLRSLAEDMNQHAIGIILSGTGSDGTRGIRAIKEHGGMVMVQDEETAKFNGMPRNAIATGLVDFILAPEDMPKQLLAFVKHPYAVQEAAIHSEDSDLTRIFALLRDKHKVDFTFYKPNTIIRRIERRVTINQCKDLKEYRDLLEENTQEISLLFQELLIGVTNFFRDENVFEEVRSKWLPKLMNTITHNELRVWIAGCSSGEEAYSVAILLAEYREHSGHFFRIKVFATDVDARAVEKASCGLYPESIAADIPPHLLVKYFLRREDSFQISQSIREMVVFAQHNLIKDPPFTNIHLLSCRNLLIYLQPVLQKKILDLFNFSLVRDGLLMLGTSESIGDMVDYFDMVSPKSKLYRSKGKYRSVGLSPTDPIPTLQNGYRPVSTQSNRPYATRFNEDKILERFVNALSKDFLPFTMIVNETLDITHIFGDAQKYLTYPSGKLITDVTKLVNKDLSIPIATGIRKALKSNESINLSNIKIREKEQARSMNIQIRLLPGRKGQETLIAILILEADHSPYEYLPSADTFDVNQDAAQRINDLEHELQLTRENLQATVEELETSNEELQATNEELLASNEELQSTNEELQSVNEELYTVNAEHQSKITELTILNNDLDNLFNSTNIGILFLDENLDIRRFTHKLQSLFHIVDNDIGRPFFHLTHSIKGIHLEEQINRVIERKAIHEQEIQTQHGNWFFMRIIPYAVSDTIFAGVILTFINIDLLKQTQDDLETQAKEEMHRLASFVNYSLDAMSLQDTAGNIITWNRGAEKLYGWTEKEALQMRFEDLVPLTDRPAMHQIVTMLRRGESIPQFESRRITKQGEIVDVSVSSSLLYPSKETGELLALTERDLRSFHEIEKKNCINCMQRLSMLLMDVSEAIVLLDFEGKIIAWNKGAEQLYGWAQQEAITMKFDTIIPEMDRAEGQIFFDKIKTGKTPYQVTQAHRLTKSNEIITVSVIASVLGYHNGETMLVVTTERPIDG
ncbi:MAG: chemotaxis protein CheB [Methylicorpusculum sp.]|uniref:chemotaxis protein CheB n=1 Tax=Methylicorpusculum sp. TaxID=2713644 RepID=UPI002723B3F0|nr:chemotaxis protein CheB [Methylicorpusculum sp.]MDO8843349.1 chemotaxis protein CheB [Methylicorpusculum sp.]MDO8937594.1 chemotaxis protein CheB [Methylicorpusculum sp.]MDP2203069.1 chemotaxis protein CheB [Methylicorpusculum sp.]